MSLDRATTTDDNSTVLRALVQRLLTAANEQNEATMVEILKQLLNRLSGDRYNPDNLFLLTDLRVHSNTILRNIINVMERFAQTVGSVLLPYNIDTATTLLEILQRYEAALANFLDRKNRKTNNNNLLYTLHEMLYRLKNVDELRNERFKCILSLIELIPLSLFIVENSVNHGAPLNIFQRTLSLPSSPEQREIIRHLIMQGFEPPTASGSGPDSKDFEFAKQEYMKLNSKAYKESNYRYTRRYLNNDTANVVMSYLFKDYSRPVLTIHQLIDLMNQADTVAVTDPIEALELYKEINVALLTVPVAKEEHRRLKGILQPEVDDKLSKLGAKIGAAVTGTPSCALATSTSTSTR